MNKAFVVLSVLLVLGNSLTDREISQQLLNGLFEQNKLKDPVTLLTCFSDASLSRVVAFVGKSLDKAARGSVTDLVTLLTSTIAFFDSLPADEMTCARANPEFQSLLPVYNVDPNDPASTERKLALYVTLHYPAVHKWMIDCDDTWNAGKYYDTGYKAGAYLHQCLGATHHQPTITEAINHILKNKEIKSQFANIYAKVRSLTREVVDLVHTISE